ISRACGRATSADRGRLRGRARPGPDVADRAVSPESTRRPEVPMASFQGRYSKQYLAGWGTMDFNGHLANTAYLDLAAAVRLSCIAEHGFPPGEFLRLALGPVIRKDELEYFREVGLHDTVTITLAALAMSPDGFRFAIENEVWTAAGERAARVVSTGGWLDLRARKLVAPPPALLAAMQQAPRSPDFVELPPLEKRDVAERRRGT